MKKAPKHIGMFINSYGPDAPDRELFVVQCTIVVACVALNVSVILLVLCINRLRSVQNIPYVFNLSCANFIFSVATLVVSIGTRYEMPTNKHICSVAAALTTFLCVAASFSRFLVSLDRYVYIADPLHYYSRTAESTVVRRILFLWIAAAFLTLSTYIVSLFNDGHSTDSNCLPYPSHVYELCVLLLGVLFPMCYEIYVYTRIFYWAFLHIQIMKQEASYCNQLRQRSVKESYNVDIYQLELFTRASLLMASTIFTMHNHEDAIQCLQESIELEAAPTSWGNTIRRVTLNSNIAGYLTSMMKFATARKSNESETDYNDRSRRNTLASFGSAIDKNELPEEHHTDSHVSISHENISESLNAEDIYIEEELRRLSRKVEAKGFKVGSKALYGAIVKLLTCTELKAGVILFLVLGTLIGCWVPVIVFTLGRNTSLHDESYSYQRKIANILVYCLSCVDPLIYDLLHQPIRAAIRDEIKHNLKHRM